MAVSPTDRRGDQVGQYVAPIARYLKAPPAVAGDACDPRGDPHVGALLGADGVRLEVDAGLTQQEGEEARVIPACQVRPRAAALASVEGPISLDRHRPAVFDGVWQGQVRDALVDLWSPVGLIRAAPPI